MKKSIFCLLMILTSWVQSQTLTVNFTPNQTVCAGTPINVGYTLSIPSGTGFSTTYSVSVFDFNLNSNIGIIPSFYLAGGTTTTGVLSNTFATGAYNTKIRYYSSTFPSGVNHTPASFFNFTVVANPTVSASSGAICMGNSYTISPSGASTYTVTGGNYIVSPTSNTSYSITGTNSGGCISASAAVVTVSVNPNPTISVNSGSICSGKSFTLVPSGASTYTIQGGSTVVSPLSNTSYTVRGTSSLGCLGVNVATANISVNSNPTVVANVNNSVICAGTTVTFTASGASTYVWTGGIVNNTLIPSSNSSYTVIGTGVNTCTNSASVSLTVNSLPILSVNSGSVCAGGVFTLNPTGANSYTYSNGSNIVSPTVNSTYTITGSNTITGCTALNPVFSTVTVYGIPTISVGGGTICAGKSFTIIPSGANTYTITGGSLVVTPNTTTSYSVTGTSSAGCISTNAVVTTVTVNALPVLSVNNGTICVGNVFTINPSGAVSYTIAGGSNTVSPTVSTSYSVIGISSAGCVGNTVTSNVVVNGLPTITISTPRNKICIGESVVLTATGASSILWNTGATTSTISVTPNTTTSFTVTGTDANGCQNSSAITQTVEACTGIEKNNKVFGVKFYPVPTNSDLNIELSGLADSEIDVNVYSLDGRLVKNSHVVLNDGKTKIDVSDIGAGVYMIELRNSSIREMRNIIVSK